MNISKSFHSGALHKCHKCMNSAMGKAAEFLICAFIGWAYEVLLTLAVDGVFVNRGLFAIPICPIYGLCALLLPPAVRLARVRSAGGIFIVTAAAATVFELAASYIIEAVLGYGLWSYSRWAFNFDGRISLFSSLIFGALGVLFIKVIRPGIESVGGKGQ